MPTWCEKTERKLTPGGVAVEWGLRAARLRGHPGQRGVVVQKRRQQRKSEPLDLWVRCLGSETFGDFHWNRLWRSDKALFCRDCPQCDVKRIFLGPTWETRAETKAQIAKRVTAEDPRFTVMEFGHVLRLVPKLEEAKGDGRRPR